VDKWQLTYQEQVRPWMAIPLSFGNHHLEDEDRQKVMAGLTAAGLIPQQVPGQTDDDFLREGL